LSQPPAFPIRPHPPLGWGGGGIKKSTGPDRSEGNCIKIKKNTHKNKNRIKKYKNKTKNMAKKSMIQRELKRQRLVMKYAKKREELKKALKETTVLKEKLALHRKLQQLPRNSSFVRLHNRCLVTGRPKGYYRDFGLSRHVLREMAHQGLLPGVTKSSW